MKGKKDSTGRRRGSAVRFLLCDPTGQSELTSSEGERVRSPIQCFDRAVNGKPRMTVIRFGEMEIPERAALVELCGALKHNHHTRQTHTFTTTSSTPAMRSRCAGLTLTGWCSEGSTSTKYAKLKSTCNASIS